VPVVLTIQTGEVSDADRQWLDEHCEALLFPSLTEGFGLPVLEALQCGRPVFISRLTCLPEVGVDLRFYRDSFSPEHMQQVLRTGLAAVHADPGYAERARAHAARFSWERAVQDYLAVYDMVLAAA
jgi:glycosyltransferase involved in cell wall biosynthesis